MTSPIRSPFLVFALSFLVMWLAARIGLLYRRRQNNFEEDARQDLDLVVAATLTLLGLIIGFSFSMAINRYDQRKNYEEAEANAIGTEYVRADLLAAADAAKVRELLKVYLDQRILFYRTSDEQKLQQINAYTAQLQSEMWTAVHAPGGPQPAPILALAVSGMNDVLNSEGYTQAAWWNRTPIGVWGLMATVGIFSCLMIGYISHRATEGFVRLLILPLILSIAFFLIADVDSPRSGVIRVVPQNLVSLSQSLPGR